MRYVDGGGEECEEECWGEGVCVVTVLSVCGTVMWVDLPWLVACLLDVWKGVVYSIILVVLDVIPIAMNVLSRFVFDLGSREDFGHHA